MKYAIHPVIQITLIGGLLALLIFAAFGLSHASADTRTATGNPDPRYCENIGPVIDGNPHDVWDCSPDGFVAYSVAGGWGQAPAYTFYGDSFGLVDPSPCGWLNRGVWTDDHGHLWPCSDYDGPGTLWVPGPVVTNALHAGALRYCAALGPNDVIPSYCR